jgi:hypothetical protein
MRFVIIPVLSWVIGGAEDPCSLLCRYEGPEICKEGSWTKHEGTCHKYVYRGDPTNLDFCYHTTETRESCPGKGLPVKAHDVARLIAHKEGLHATTTSTTLGPETSLLSTLEELPVYSAGVQEDFYTLDIEIHIKESPRAVNLGYGKANVVMSATIDTEPVFRFAVECADERFWVSPDGLLGFDSESSCVTSFIEELDDDHELHIFRVPLVFETPNYGKTHILLIDFMGDQIRLNRSYASLH